MSYDDNKIQVFTHNKKYLLESFNFIYIHDELYPCANPQMKAVAGLKMSYQVQQAINGSKGALIRGFRHDDSDVSLCAHLYTLVRGNRQYRRAFLISLLNLFDDSSVSSPFCFSLCRSEGVIVSHHPLSEPHCWSQTINLTRDIFHFAPCRKQK